MLHTSEEELCEQKPCVSVCMLCDPTYLLKHVCTLKLTYYTYTSLFSLLLKVWVFWILQSFFASCLSLFRRFFYWILYLSTTTFVFYFFLSLTAMYSLFSDTHKTFRYFFDFPLTIFFILYHPFNFMHVNGMPMSDTPWSLSLSTYSHCTHRQQHCIQAT